VARRQQHHADAALMPKDRVQVSGHLARPAAEVWAVLRDFCGVWHPLIATIAPERDARGALIRAFTLKDEAGTYREQQTWVSDSDRTLGYTHLEGITECQAYDARVTVSPSETGCTVSWTADVRAPMTRLGAICEGTKAVFQMGIAALAEARLPQVEEEEISPVAISARSVDSLPRLALSVTPPLGKRDLVLFLHGIGGARWNWHPQLSAVGSLMQAASLDLRGYGDSTLGQAQSTIDDYCADILRVKEVLGAERLVLVGLSYGSWIATSFAMRHPEMLAGLVLSGGCTGMSEAGPDEREAFRLSREVPLNAGQTPRDFAPAVVKVLAGPNASETVRQDLFNSMAAISAATYRDALTCFTNPLERFDFSRLTMPVLLMTGAYDRLAPPDEIRGVAGRIWDNARHPDLRFEVIDDAGHVCNVEQPETYNRHLLAFLRKLAS
jgi:pimeloyl-ACP methyl ester carboxylesterase